MELTILDITINTLLLLPLLMLAFGNLHFKEVFNVVTINIGNVKDTDNIKFAYEFPAVKPFINIRLSKCSDQKKQVSKFY